MYEVFLSVEFSTWLAGFGDEGDDFGFDRLPRLLVYQSFKIVDHLMTDKIYGLWLVKGLYIYIRCAMISSTQMMPTFHYYSRSSHVQRYRSSLVFLQRFRSIELESCLK